MIVLREPQYTTAPFPHFSCAELFGGDSDKNILSWLSESGLWSLTKTDFYTQYEFSLLDQKLPPHLDFLLAAETLDLLKDYFQEHFRVAELELVGLTAHKLTEGHRMGVHNDFIGLEESHRLVIQLNENWQQENGGFLMLFNSSNPQDVAKIVKPIHNTAIGFEISPASYHAVSTVHNYNRYTLVYTFNGK